MDDLIESLNNLDLNNSKSSSNVCSTIKLNITEKLKNINKNKVIDNNDINFLIGQMDTLTLNISTDDNIKQEQTVFDLKIKLENAIIALINKSRYCDVYGDNLISLPYQEAF